MAERESPKLERDDEHELTFKNVQLFKNETLGTGGYGAVCKAKYDQLICAAKLLYPVLFQMQAPDPGKEHRQPINRFEQECRFLSRVNHPNIVQYLGTYRDPETNAPVLLMELMDESLTHFLESSPGDIPYHIQVNLSQDIAQALAFLHANGIIHRDLSSNNVLLIAGSRAKVSDFGMSRFEDLNKTHLATMTTCPGTPAFMSPEALDEPPVYTEKLDNFSFGVLLVQIVTRQFPAPGDRFETVLIPSPRDPTRTVKSRLAIPEVERRQAHISLIEPTHPLLPIALECLKDEAVERPSSQQLCQSLYTLKETTQYEDSVHQTARIILTKNELTHELNRQLQMKNGKIYSLQQEIVAREKQHVEDTALLRAENQQRQSEVETGEQQLRRLNQQLESNEEITATLQQTIAQRDWEIVELREMLATASKQPPSEATTACDEDQTAAATRGVPLSLVWETLPQEVIKTDGVRCALMGYKAYFRSNRIEVWEFNSLDHQWTKLCNPPVGTFTLVNLNNMLTVVGGCGQNWLGNPVCSDKVYSYINKRWVEEYPPMPTKRWACTAVYTKSMLIVAGGHRNCDCTEVTAIVEVLNTVNKQWIRVSSLPFPISWPSAALCGEYIYLLSGHTSSDEEYSVIRCNCSDLLRSTTQSNMWERIASLPVFSSTLVVVRGHLLAVGGQTLYGYRTDEIHHYDFFTNSWQVISRMSVARSSCCAAVLPNHKLMVVGGASDTLVIEMASVSSK